MKFDGIDVDTSFVSSLIPLVMNSMYNADSFRAVSLQEIRDAFRVKQVQSKSWLLQHLDQHQVHVESKILVIGSWLGFTSLCLHHLGYTYITEVDIDHRLAHFARHLNRFNRGFTHVTDDANNLDYSGYDVVINTSCEHIVEDKWFHAISNQSLVILHSNNLEGHDHVNTCVDLADMSRKYPLNLSYSGELDFGGWKRFMLIGKKS